MASIVLVLGLLLPLSVIKAQYDTPGSSQYQSPGSWTMNASVPEVDPTTSGCIILAQLTTGTNPPVLQAMQPICPPSVNATSSPSSVRWPIAGNANDGQGTSSALAIYAQVLQATNLSGTAPYQAQAGCVMEVTTEQVQYLLARSLTWSNDYQELYDDTASGYIMNSTTGPALACSHDETLLPSDLRFPSPHAISEDDPSWQVPITLNPSGELVGTSTLDRVSTASSSVESVPSTTTENTPKSSSTSVTTTTSLLRNASTASVSIASTSTSTSTVNVPVDTSTTTGTSAISTSTSTIRNSARSTSTVRIPVVTTSTTSTRTASDTTTTQTTSTSAATTIVTVGSNSTSPGDVGAALPPNSTTSDTGASQTHGSTTTLTQSSTLTAPPLRPVPTTTNLATSSAGYAGCSPITITEVYTTTVTPAGKRRSWF